MNIKAGVVAYNELYWWTKQHDWFDKKNFSTQGTHGLNYNFIEKYRIENLNTSNVFDLKLPMQYGLIEENDLSIPKIFFSKKIEHWGKCKVFPFKFNLSIDHLQGYANELGRAVGIIEKDDKNSTYSKKGFIGMYSNLNFNLEKELYAKTINKWKEINSDFSPKLYQVETENSLIQNHAIINFGNFGLLGLNIVLIPFFTEGKIVENSSDLLDFFLKGLLNDIEKKRYNFHLDYFLNNYVSGIKTSQDELIINSLATRLNINKKEQLKKIRGLNLFKILKDDIKAELSSGPIRSGGDLEESYNFDTSGLDSNESILKGDKYLLSFKYHPKCGKGLGSYNFENEVNQLTDSLKLNFLKNYSKKKHLKTLVYQESVRKLIDLIDLNKLVH